MYGVVVIVLLYWLARHYGGSSGVAQRPSGPARETRRQRLLLLAFIIWSIFTGLFFGFLAEDTLYAQLLLLFGATVMQPALLAHLSMRMGWVRMSYYLGRVAIVANRHSLLGGGLFYGWRALQKHRDNPGVYEAGRAFLQKRLDRNGRLIDSGGLLMQIVMMHDQLDEERFYRRLLLLGRLDLACATPGLVRYGFRLLAAHALGRGDWERLLAVTPQWRVPLAGYLSHTYRRMKQGKIPSPVDLFLYWLWSGRPRWSAQLPAVAPATAIIMDSSLSGLSLRQQSWLLAGKALPEEMKQAWRVALTQEPVWRERAAQLGCRNIDAALDNLGQSVGNYLDGAVAHAKGVAVAEADIDMQFQKLHFKARAIESRRAQGQLLAGNLECEEFLSLLDLFEQLAGDAARQYQAYCIFENVVWNWIAALWNDKKEKWLVYFMCGCLYGYAKSVDSESAVVYDQILRGHVR